MKVENITISKFKRFSEEPFELDFKNKTLGEVSNRFLLLGDNGTGKTTILQAIALPLALAGRICQQVEDFDWIGFDPGRYYRWGTPRIEVEVSFSDDEISATREVARLWDEQRPQTVRESFPLKEPGTSRSVHLTLQGGSCRAENSAEYFQFSGRYYARQLLKRDASARSFFPKLPGVFWLDQFRSNATRDPEINGRHVAHGDLRFDENIVEGPQGKVSYAVGVAQLRSYLIGWKLISQSASQANRDDWLLRIENLYKQCFPGRSFAGLEPMPGVSAPSVEDYYFLLNDGQRTYDIGEMSGGEQAVFPLLFRCVQLHISNSVVLIDEVDLHQHPSSVQRVIRNLPRIAPECQVIMSSHSSAVSDIMGPDDTYRLPGGSLCL